MPLTGQPAVGGVLLPYMALEAPCLCEWDDSESDWQEFEDGPDVRIRARFRLKGTGGWNNLSETDLAQLKYLLRDPFMFTPRTQAPTDNAIFPELAVPCRRTSPIPETNALFDRMEGGEQRYRLSIEFVSIVTYETIPNELRGGFYRLPSGETPYAVQVASYGLTRTTGTVHAVYGAMAADVTTLHFEPADTVNVLVRDTPGENRSQRIDFLNDLVPPGTAVPY